MSESAREVEASEENLYKSLSEKGNMWRRKGGCPENRLLSGHSREFKIKSLQ